MEQPLYSTTSNCKIIHQGKESCVYEFESDGNHLILKTFEDPSSVRLDTLGKIKNVKGSGFYKIQKLGEVNQKPYIIYEYIPGIPSSETAMPVAIALFALRQITQTLNLLQKQGISHGDLNPGNIILKQDGATFRTILIDFGIVGPGALAYAAPERFQGNPPNIQSDAFSLGLLLYRLICGSDLITAKTFDGYATEINNIHLLDISKKLFLSKTFSPAEIKALEPLWDILLKGEPLQDGFEELDENLEIALKKLYGGEIAFQKAQKDFTKNIIEQKLQQKVPPGKNCPFPLQISANKPSLFSIKNSVLAAILLIFLGIGIYLALSHFEKDVDDAGEQVLKKSRDIKALSESVNPIVKDSIQYKIDSSRIMEQPTP